jgi:hypothetical protein
MDTTDKTAPVTRGEFHQALVLVWTFIALAFATTVFSASRSVPHIIYFVVSLVMVANYAGASWRSDRSRTRVMLAVGLAVVALAVAFVAAALRHGI